MAMRDRMTLIANLLPSSHVSHVRKIKPKYFKLMVIIALAVGKRKGILMCNFVLYACGQYHEGHSQL
jgi:hypothetical protein